MRVCIYSGAGLGLSIWKRLADEGSDVLVYVEEQHCKRVGEGIVPKCNNYAQWVAWGRQDPKTIFLFDLSGAGEKADALRKAGCLVVGGCKFFDRLEKDRAWSEQLHASIGIAVPESHRFSTISDARNFAASNKATWVFKTNQYIDASTTYLPKDPEDLVHYLDYIEHAYGNSRTCILQEKLDGFALSTARWFNGKTFVGPYEATLEHKKFLNDDKGPATGCSLNCIFYYQDDEPKIAKNLHWDALGDLFRKNESAPGLYDINALLSEDDGKPYFLESTPRFGWDSEATSQKGITNYSELLYNLAMGLGVDHLFNRELYFNAVKLSVPPYPYEGHIGKLSVRNSCLDVPVWGTDGLWSKHFIGYGLRHDPEMGLVVADELGWVGLSSAMGKDPLSPFDACYAFIDKKLRVPNLQFRTDAKERIEEDLDAIVDLDYQVR